MPIYPGPGQAKLLRDNTQGYFWRDEAVATGNLSQAFMLERINRSFYPWGLSVEVLFSGNPGAFELDIMGANSDSSRSYIQLGTITAVNGFNVGRWDMPSNLWPKFVAGYVSAIANPSALLTMVVTK